ncbi:transmembrane protein 87A [Panicum miliaceum]|uniref:Transmembrane protein 87A n=1 Tax=Panicum miliaceum TaxID=4540 RepID=A0A3L6S7W3_PANMI|nr:transmembrane protein 87A [Panicum miliaceum]
MRPPRRAALSLALGLSLVALLAARGADASVHEYTAAARGSTRPTRPPTPPHPSSVFRRTLESASRHEEMQQKTGLVEAIIVEIQDRDKIGGSYLHSDAICCTPELDKEKFCRFVQCWKDILQLHYHITAVIALGMCEMAFWYFEYANFNSTGTRPMGITIWAVTFTAVKKTVSRLLLLVVSMGYEALELVENLGNINDFSGKTRTLEKLQLRRSMAKLELYRKFTNSLAVSVLISIAWSGYESPTSVFTVPVMDRFAYSEDAGEGADEEGLSLVGSAMKGTGDMRSTVFLWIHD